MEVNAKTPNTPSSIMGVTANFPQPYLKGHELTDKEAIALNGLLKENVRNLVREAIKTHLSKGGKPDEVQSIVDKCISHYEFGAGGGGRTSDPVDKEAVSIARTRIEVDMTAKGQKVANIEGGAKAITKMARELAAADPSIRKQAASIVAMRQKAVESIKTAA